MASAVVNRADVFPVGTTVYAYPLSNWTTGQRPPSGAPVGSSTTSAAVAANGSVTFTGLADDTWYVAYAQVSSAHRYVNVSTFRKRNPVQAVGDATDGQALVWDDAEGQWEPGSAGVSQATVNTTVAAATPWLTWVHGQGRPATNTGFTTLGTSGQRTSASQSDEIGWDFYLAAGTWEFWMVHITNNNRGIYTVTLDGAAVGTVDGYSAGSVTYVEAQIAGHVVATAGVKRLLLKMSTKNASSSAYVGSIQLCGMRRTA
jgi:hypothetical protein